MSDAADVEEIVVPDDKKGEAAKEAVATKEELASLRNQLAEAAEREKAATERVNAVGKDADDARTGQWRAVAAQIEAQKAAAANALAAATAEVEAIKSDLGRLTAEGKFDDLADAQVRLARAAGRISDAERYRDWVAGQDRDFQARVKHEQTIAEERAKQPIEDQPNVSAKTKAWIDAHPKFNADLGYRKKVLAAHAYVTDIESVAADSEEYFNRIEEILGERTPDDDGAEEPVIQKRQPQRGTSSAVAPSRSTSTTREKEKRYTLSRAEQEMADATMRHIKDPTERYRKYAENRQRMLAENPLVQGV